MRCWSGIRFYPIKMSFSPGIGKAQCQYENKYHSLDHRKPSTCAIGLFHELFIRKNGCPWKQKDDLYLKQNKNQGNNVKTNIELGPGRTDSFFTTFVGEQFFGVRTVRANQL